MKLISYLRVSTQRQGDSGLGEAAQRHTVEQYAKNFNHELVGEFVEIESGRKPDRPKLAEAVADCKQLGATLIFAKLDRMSRDVKTALNIVDAGVPLIFADLPEIGRMEPAVGRLILTTMAAVSEFEARRIGQRTKEALAARRAQGKPMGRHNQTKCYFTNEGRIKGQKKGVETRRKKCQEFYALMYPKLATLQQIGFDEKQIAETMNKQGRFDRGNKLWTQRKIKEVLTSHGSSDSPRTNSLLSA